MFFAGIFLALINLTPLGDGSVYSTLAGDAALAWKTATGHILFREVNPATREYLFDTTNETSEKMFHSAWYTSNDPLVPYTPPVMPTPAPSTIPTLPPLF